MKLPPKIDRPLILDPAIVVLAALVVWFWPFVVLAVLVLAVIPKVGRITRVLSVVLFYILLAGMAVVIHFALWVASRHAGPGDSLILINALLNDFCRYSRIVMKETLQVHVMRSWYVASDENPHGRAARQAWLFDWWARIDEWIDTTDVTTLGVR